MKEIVMALIRQSFGTIRSLINTKNKLIFIVLVLLTLNWIFDGFTVADLRGIIQDAGTFARNILFPPTGG